jgi:hypothetical protein
MEIDAIEVRRMSESSHEQQTKPSTGCDRFTSIR